MAWVAAAIGGGTALMGAITASNAAKMQASSAEDQLDAAEKVRRQNMRLGRMAFDGQSGVYGRTLQAQTGVAGDMYRDQRGIAGDYQTNALGTSADYMARTGQATSDYMNRSLDSAQYTLGGQLDLYHPYYQTGTAANNALAIEMGLAPGESQFQTTPGYDFRMNEGIGAVEGSAAAAGGLMSGATMDAVNYTAQGIADQEYDDYTANLFGLSGQGMAAAGGMANAYGQFGASTQNTYGNVANMNQSAYGNVANMNNQAYANTANMQTNAATGYGNNMYGAYGTYGANMGNAYGNTFNALAGVNSQYGADSANAYANIGNAQAAGAVAPYNAMMAGAGNALGLWNYQNSVQPQTPPTYGQGMTAGYYGSGGIY